jgi:hypothetical protein
MTAAVHNRGPIGGRQSAERGRGAAAMAVVAAIVLALLSVRIERTGPQQVAYSNLCGPTMSDLCYRPVLKGGFPIAYLFDAPGVSVEEQLGFGEDNLHYGALVADIALYFIAVLIILRVAARGSAVRLRADVESSP